MIYEFGRQAWEEGKKAGIEALWLHLTKKKDIYIDPSEIPNPRDTGDWDAAVRAKIPKRPTAEELGKILLYHADTVSKQRRLFDLEHDN